MSDQPSVMIEVEKLKQLFDLIVGSLNFGSGFLDQDDIDLLREVAVVIGVDPMEGTSSEFKTSYPHSFKPYDPPGGWSEAAAPERRPCYYCGNRPADPIHGEARPA